MPDYIQSTKPRILYNAFCYYLHTALIWYTGHGQQDTGNWCFSDDVITFDEIAELYIQYFEGRLLYIVSDCCYSGQWVRKLEEKLDGEGIRACGHRNVSRGYLVKLAASCQEDQVAYDTCYSEHGAYYSYSAKCILFWKNRELPSGQVTSLLDTTQINCLRSPQETWKCPACSQLPWHSYYVTPVPLKQ